MPARNGKIANLPNDIREQLNLRLLEGETGRDLTAWLNALPEVQSVLSSQFNGSAISEVNLTYWRQGSYLQWLTERECFGAARALAEGDSSLASAGLSAERLLNILTLRFGQLLLRWDTSSDDCASESAAFSETARKARILQGISRSVLAIHRLQSRSALSKTGGERCSLSSPPSPSALNSLAPKLGSHLHGRPATESVPESAERLLAAAVNVYGPKPDETPSTHLQFPGMGASSKSHSEILSGPISPSRVHLNLSQTPFGPEPNLGQILKAV